MTPAESSNACGHVGNIKVCSGGSLNKVKPLFTHDSKFLLVASGCAIKVFSVASGECILTFKGHDNRIVSIRQNKQNKLQVFSCSDDGIVIRWDYSDGIALKKYTLKAKKKVQAFYAPTAEGAWFYTSKLENNDATVYHLMMNRTKPHRIQLILPMVQSHENAVAFGPEGRFIAGISRYGLHVRAAVMFEQLTEREHRVKPTRLTCVACHPIEPIIATGDRQGRIILWTNAVDTLFPTRSIYHWHSASLPGLTFSAEGAHMYSAGNESVLVKWNLNEDTKVTIPRLGLPMCDIISSPDNKFIATSHIDNALKIINSRNIVVQVIQGLAQGQCLSSKMAEKAPTGMVYDPLTGALVMNGQPGHLQFYDMKTDKLLFQLDIVGRTFVSQERDSVVYNTDVEKAAINCSGLWLATVECRDDGETSLEMSLKFWQYDITVQKYKLNTKILLPHNKKVNCIKFRPELQLEDSDEKLAPLAVTTSDDNHFKIWTYAAGRESSWSCELVGYYKDLQAGDACFSEDGSTLAVVFDFIITLWSPETNILKATLSHPTDSSPIRKVLFGRNKCSHLLVCHNDNMLTVWNLLSLSALWHVKCDIQYIVDDPLSDIMASFSKDGHVFVFKPSHPKPVAVIKNDITPTVLSAMFVPRAKTRSEKKHVPCCWQYYSQLYFMDEDQLLLTINDNDHEEENIDSTESLTLKKIETVTPFALLQAEHSVTGVKPVKPEIQILNVDKEDHEYPCPTHVNTISLCNTILSAALKPYLKKTAIIPETEDTNCVEMNTDVSIGINSANKIQPQEDSKTKLDKSLESTTLREIDFSFLLDYV